MADTEMADQNQTTAEPPQVRASPPPATLAMTQETASFLATVLAETLARIQGASPTGSPTPQATTQARSPVSSEHLDPALDTSRPKVQLKIPTPPVWTPDNPSLPRGKVWFGMLAHYLEMTGTMHVSVLPTFFGGKSAEWLSRLCSERDGKGLPTSFDHVREEFLAFYDPYHDDDETIAREHLIAGDVRMTSTVREFAMRFLSEVRRAGGMEEPVKIILFQRGLTPLVAQRCQSDIRGSRFTDLASLIKHADGIERELALRLPPTSPPAAPTPTRSALHVQTGQHKRGQRQANGANAKKTRGPDRGYDRAESGHRLWQFVHARGWTIPGTAEPYTREAFERARRDETCLKCGNKRTQNARGKFSCPVCPPGSGRK